ncbi:autophagy protein 6, variant 2 [Globodera pallida]|nr:autophagy protein 6 [Globodera pallida]KAI3416367.1 autophagy protein 6, variant 2 [Globodera pallida]
MCKKCANTVTAELNKQLGHLEKECIQYKKSLDHLLQRRADCPFDKEASRIKLDALKSEERDLLEQLALLEGEERTLMHELEAKQAERRQIGQQDEELYRRLRDNHRTLIEQADEQRSLKLQIKQSNEQIRRLSRMNVLDMVFHIWVDGEYGTISGFRLGRLRHDQVEWSEINAALGQMTFLLKVIAERLDFEFVSYELVPCGSTSAIRILPKNGTTTAPISTAEELPLYGSGGWRPFGQQALDKALVAFMDCVCQVEQRLKQYFPSGTQLLPYRMLKDKIVDKDSQYLVKMQLNSEERWTKAMKCLLLNLKRVIGILTTLPLAAAVAQQQQQQQQTPSPTVESRTPTTTFVAGIAPTSCRPPPTSPTIEEGPSSSGQMQRK